MLDNTRLASPGSGVSDSCTPLGQRPQRVMVEILIPTFNRVTHLVRNLEALDKQIGGAGSCCRFRILVSDNCSSDGTYEEVSRLASHLKVDVELFRQEANVGLERNAIFLLDRARADFVMYLGDDDYLPEGYLEYVADKVTADQSLGAIVPCLEALHSDGSTTPARDGPLEEVKFKPSFGSVRALSPFGHQLSGIVVRRDGLLEEYTRDESLRNLYPFVFFLGFSSLHGNTYFNPKYKVAISVYNSKDWKYDSSGLLTEILRNYRILFPSCAVRRLLCGLQLIKNQPWRLRIGTGAKSALSAFLHIQRSSHVDISLKIAIAGIYAFSYARIGIAAMTRRVRRTSSPS